MARVLVVTKCRELQPGDEVAGTIEETWDATKIVKFVLRHPVAARLTPVFTDGTQLYKCDGDDEFKVVAR